MITETTLDDPLCDDVDVLEANDMVQLIKDSGGSREELELRLPRPEILQCFDYLYSPPPSKKIKDKLDRR